MNNTTIFSEKAAIYASVRPNYAPEFLEFLSQTMGIGPKSKIADIGSGTGIFTHQLLGLGCEVFAVEPNDEMRSFAEQQLRQYPLFHSVNATAETTTLPDKSVDLITVAQAFHWFETEKFKSECQRILRGNKEVVLVWNNGLPNPNQKFAGEVKELFDRFYPSPTRSAPSLTIDEKIKNFFHDYEKISFPNSRQGTVEQNIQRYLSTSHAFTPRDKEYAQFVPELRRIYQKYAVGGMLTEHMNTVAYIGRV